MSRHRFIPKRWQYNHKNHNKIIDLKYASSHKMDRLGTGYISNWPLHIQVLQELPALQQQQQHASALLSCAAAAASATAALFALCCILRNSRWVFFFVQRIPVLFQCCC